MNTYLFIAVLLASTFVIGTSKLLGETAEKRIESFGPVISNTQIYKTEEASEVRQGPYDLKQQEVLEIARQFASTKLTNSEFLVKDIYKSQINGVTHVYLLQVIDGREVVNSNINLNVDANGRVISHGNSFFRGRNTFKRQAIPIDKATGEVKAPTLDHFGVLKSLAKYLHTELADPENITIETEYSPDGKPIMRLTNVSFAVPDSQVLMRQVLIQTENGHQIQPAWEIEVEMENNWFQAYIHEDNGNVLSMVNWVADAYYNVFPFGQNDPSEGPRKMLKNPQDLIASPKGWHVQGDTKNFTETIGNNVYAYENLDGPSFPSWKGRQRANGGENLIFDFPLDLSQNPKTYLNASITNLFYWTNLMHDLFYRYGFDEVAGNFQEDNGGRGGKGNDAIFAIAQGASIPAGTEIILPPDGQPARMRLYVWTRLSPYRDGDLDAGLIIHEYSHGISSRLTGGPNNANCLNAGEAAGLSEGWSDFFATILRTTANHTRASEFAMGVYVNGKGIRRYPYSTSFRSNPETYGIMNNLSYAGAHPKGTVWANMLYEVYWNLVDVHGFNPEWFPPITTDWNELRKYITSKGNTLMLQIVVDGLKLQPCRPNFTQARDAILQAEKLLTNGKFACDIWKGFAKRGLGIGARVIVDNGSGRETREESFKLPQEC
ncbi:uncharacterized protein VTP21DRAFT_1099 [Calcarisporiella thermophila]|uniref:uncharacterized protein n=1 Tax=Calcarisporiella thermophila TaxID=911321 RepID=UPI003744A112